MVVNALAAQAKSSPALTVGRFLSTSRSYSGLNPVPDQRGAEKGEFVDPPRYRNIFQETARRTAA
jgi:hypothetical protein